MRLFLVRHGETVDNVAGVYAGITDSALTNHGVLQANRLDLVRAFKTAEAIRLTQPKPANEQAPFAHETKQLTLLREQDFGSLEGKASSGRSRDSKKTGKDVNENDSEFRDVETQEAMRTRSNAFIDEYLLDLFHSVTGDYAVVVVAHGIILAHLWRCILRRFPPTAVSVAPGVVPAERGLLLEFLGSWSNTGYMELEIKPREGESSNWTSPTMKAPTSATLAEAQATTNEANKRILLDMLLVMKAVNSLVHLKKLKKTRGGIGSSKHDESQKTIGSFFKKRKIG